MSGHPTGPRYAPWTQDEIDNGVLVWGAKRCGGPCGRELPASTDFFVPDDTRYNSGCMTYDCRECRRDRGRRRYAEDDAFRERKRALDNAWHRRQRAQCAA